MKELSVFLRLAAFVLLAFPALAQRPCATDALFRNKKGSEYFPGGRIFESKLKEISTQQNKSVTADNDSIYYIPVVVHVLHYGESIGIGRNISQDRIQSQIDILNQDYGKTPNSPGYNTFPAGVDTRIRFCLATVDPNGNPTNGVVRVQTTQDAFDLFSQNTILKGYSNWDPEKYLNIWVCRLLGNFIGYAQYPMISPQWADSLPMVPNVEDVQPDGVVIEYRVFGNVPNGQGAPFGVYNKGRTASHEVGHYLGLLHIWGDGGSCADNKTDFCSDTPPQATYTSGCPSVTVESCTPGVPALVENYMDYSNDTCMNVFTLEQKKRMRIVLRNCVRRKSVASTTQGCEISTGNPPKPPVLVKKLYLEFVSGKDYLNVKSEDIKLSEINLYNYLGRKIESIQISSNYATYPYQLNLAGLSRGTYFIKAKDTEGIYRIASFCH